VLALYRVREGKLARARMFFFDPEAAARFLADAGGGPPSSALFPEN
jgi:hypothetical protein